MMVVLRKVAKRIGLLRTVGGGLTLMLLVLFLNHLVTKLGHLLLHATHLLLVLLLGGEEVHGPLALLRALDELLEELRVDVSGIIEAIRIGYTECLGLGFGDRRHVQRIEQVRIGVYMGQDQLHPPERGWVLQNGGSGVPDLSIPRFALWGRRKHLAVDHLCYYLSGRRISNHFRGRGSVSP